MFIFKKWEGEMELGSEYALEIRSQGRICIVSPFIPPFYSYLELEEMGRNNCSKF